MLKRLMKETETTGRTYDKEQMQDLEARLERLQRACKERQIPVVILMEGFSAAGKGMLTSRMIHPWDPRGFYVTTFKDPDEEESRYPFLWRFWNNIPGEGQIAVYHKGWYEDVLSGMLTQQRDRDEFDRYAGQILDFEQQLTDSGMIVIKFFAYISKKEQKKRFRKLEEDKDTSWRVTKRDWEQNKKYDAYLDLYNEMIDRTNTVNAPWYILRTEEKNTAVGDMMRMIVNRLERELERGKDEIPVRVAEVFDQPLESADLSLSLTREEYRERLKKLQKRIGHLHSEIYRRRIPVVFVFEGWDAGGKGGAIKRLTEYMDPRGYVVNPVMAPRGAEKTHHYLWRFWKNIPKDGHIALFDRSWYGRVLVERLEGFCSEADWKRAYNELNQFEKTLTDHGAVVLKFWLQIDKDEQEARFRARQENPEKQWKITDEDWRNREKWDEYEVAVNEMIARTDKPNAPWVIVEGNSKYYARIKVLEKAVEAMEEKILQVKL